MARRKPEDSSLGAPKSTPPEPGEFVVGRPEFRVGGPLKKPRDETSSLPADFVIGGPTTDIPKPAPAPPSEFQIGGPLPSTGRHAGLPPLPRGWEPLPTQPPWTFPDDEPTGPGELRRIDKPRKRYRGLSAIRAYVDPDRVEEIIDLLVFNAKNGVAGPGSVSAFLFESVREELTVRRKADSVGDRYPTYSEDGIRPRRGRRSGDRQVTPSKGEALRPVVARIPAVIADEIRDCVIHRNDGQPAEPNTVSQFVADAISNALTRQRDRDKVTRYPTSRPNQREAYLDPRVLRSSG